ncbi:hypothetical protein ABW19_dt0207313 [Dactylella cylindrospora]|nr:hypothetical protein ABW19_dt0207313 [Dactylella cylindrospora]
MMRQSRPDVLDLIPAARSRSRSQSISSDTAFSGSAPGSSMSAPLIGVSPEAAYIAASAATQIVTSDHESFFQTLCTEGIVKPGPPTIHVTPDALRLVNQFLDYLLWSILSVGKSTTLKSLRPAVTEVLKSRLAREAITSAEAELEEYLGDADEDEVDDENEEFDIERCWKKARLRCMIYSSLGDLEEDDEDAYSESDYPSSPANQFGRSSPTAVSPAVAIFLTSILEFIGEQTLLVAGHATVARFSQARIAAAAEEGPDGPFEAVDRPSVEELDMEKVALNPVLGRMWRQWKKLLRGPGGGQIASRAPSIRRDSRRQSTISAISIQSVLESKADTGKVSPENRDLTAKVPDTERVSPVEEHLIANPKVGLRRLASAEVLGSAPLTPIPETPRNADGSSSAKLPSPEIEIMKFESHPSDLAEFPRPSSMIDFPSNTSHFVFPFSKPQVNDVPDTIVREEEEVVDRPKPRRARSKSLPLPGSFPFTPEELELSLAPWTTMKSEEDVPTPIPQTAPQLPLPEEHQGQDTESMAETEGVATDIDDEEGDLSTVDSIVVHDTVEATATTPTFYKAQSVRIISSGTPPIGFNIVERRSSSTINTLPEKSTGEDVRSEEVDVVQDEVSNDRQSITHAPEEIGIARTSDLFIAPVSLPTPVQSPVVNQNVRVPSPIEEKTAPARRPSADSTSESNHSVRDIVKERRRRSKYYIPAPAPSAPDFYPEHHTQEEIAEHYKQKEAEAAQPQPAPPVEEAYEDPPPIPPARKSPREELMELYGADPEFDEDQIPTKRPTIKPTRPIQRATSPLGPAPSPGLSHIAQSNHSDSSESLTTRSHTSSGLGGDRRQYPSIDLPRPSSNRDIPTPTSAHGERAGLRVWTPPATPDATKGGRSMRSTSFSKPKGHGHSNSISSQTSQKLKTLITGRPTTAEDKRQGSRHESDNDSAYSETQTFKIDEKERSFEQLINSGTTLQYTLTPDNVKRIDLEMAEASSRKGSADSGRIKNSGDKYVPIVTPPATQSAPPPRRSSSMKSRPLTTIASEDYEEGVPNIPAKPPRSPRVMAPKAPNAENIKFFPPRSTSASGSISQPPRGASLQPINTAIRPNVVSQPVSQGPQSPIRSPKSAVIGTAVRSPIIPSRPPTNSLDEIRPLRSSVSRSKLVARAPQSATADSTLALIDFFRNTPPPVNGPGAVSRPVRSNPPPVTSPYKSTLDPRSTATPQGSMTSINEKSNSLSSFNSQADLIKKPEPQPPVRSQQRPHTGGPERKQVRIRDPYAIDSDDDEIFERPAPKPKRQEESLADFLKNVPPPPEPSPTPSQQTFQQPVLKKKSSAAQLIGRFRSSSSKNSQKITKQNVSSPIEARHSPHLQNGINGSTTSLPARKHVPLPVRSNLDEQYPPRAKSSGAMSPPPMPRRPIFQARDAKTHAADSDSSGLADFLRYTGPPVNVEPAMPTEKEDNGRFKSMGFSNKKKRGIAV